MRNTLSAWTTFGIGGKAKRITVARSRGELIDAAPSGLVLGRGSNVLASDDGYDGTVLINRYESVELIGSIAVAGSGTRLSVLCGYLTEAGLSGLEWAEGIPASVGGAVRMNAGAFGGETSERLLYVDVLRDGREQRLYRDELKFDYRKGALQDGDIVIAAAFVTDRDSPTAVKARCERFKALRTEKQPKGKSAGSIFKNPSGVSVGKVLDDAGLKGLSVGGAVISQKHANIIVNTGGATAKDVCRLISIMRDVLLEKGIEAQEEIIYIGGF